MLSKDVQVAVSLFALATAQSLPAFVAAHSELIEGHCVWFFLFFGTCIRYKNPKIKNEFEYHITQHRLQK